MNIEKILDEWEKDLHIDISKLHIEALRSQELFHKYRKYKAYVSYKLRMHESDLKALWDDLDDYYQGSADQELLERLGLEQYQLNRVVASKIRETKISAHPLYIKKTSQGMALRETDELLKDILKAIDNRRWDIRNSIEFQKFQAGQ